MSSRRVLVVDDEIECCDIFRRFLEKEKFLVDVAYDGKQASDLLKDIQYEFIFFDCDMPELSGTELIEIIKEHNPKAKRIMVSGYVCLEEEFLKMLGVHVYLKKPVKLEQMREVLGLSKT